MTRTILVHLNVTVPDDDERGADEIADAILAAIEVGSDDESVRSLGVGGLASGNDAPISCPLAEEVEGDVPCPTCGGPTTLLTSDVDGSSERVCESHGAIPTPGEPVVGEFYRGDHYSGIFVGYALDEEDGIPYAYFVRGEINGHPQTSFGFPARNDASPISGQTPTQLIREALAERSA